MVEHFLAKEGVASSNLVSRFLLFAQADRILDSSGGKRLRSIWCPFFWGCWLLVISYWLEQDSPTLPLLNQ